jgi:phosphoribosylformylglycinamidine (FGAM) synthase-like enzyme
MDMMLEVFRFGVKGIVNFVDKNNIPIQFETVPVVVGNDSFYVVSSKVLNRIPMKIILEVGAKIFDISKLSEQEEKN